MNPYQSPVPISEPRRRRHTDIVPRSLLDVVAIVLFPLVWTWLALFDPDIHADRRGTNIVASLLAYTPFAIFFWMTR